MGIDNRDLSQLSIEELLAALETAVADDDQLQIARIRRQLHERDLIDDDEFDQELAGGHPSLDGIAGRRLHLVKGGMAASEVRPQISGRRMTDLVGVATVKRALAEIIETAQHRVARSTGAWLGSTLLYGPPSCGKTFAVEVIAGELQAPLWNIDLTQNWRGGSFGELIERIESETTEQGSILFLNHLDHPRAREALGANIGALDDARTKSRVMIFGAAVSPWAVQNSIARVGRLVRPLLVLPPDPPSRQTFIEAQLSGRAKAAKEDLDWIVGRTDGHSFADLTALVNVVVANTSGATVPREAWRLARRDVPPSCAEWLSTAAHHAMMNEAGGVYDDLLNYFANRQKY